jgi:hypothetical protein
MTDIELTAADLAAAGEVFGLWVEQGRGVPEWGILSIAAIIARHMAPEREGIAIIEPSAADLAAIHAAIHEIYATQPDFEAVAAIIAKHLEPERERARRMEDALRRLHGLAMHLFPEDEKDVAFEQQYHARMEAARAALEKL